MKGLYPLRNGKNDSLSSDRYLTLLHTYDNERGKDLSHGIQLVGCPKITLECFSMGSSYKLTMVQKFHVSTDSILEKYISWKQLQFALLS